MSKSGAAKEWDYAGFMANLARLREQKGIGSYAELGEKIRARGNLPNFNPSAMSKWSPRVQPSIETLREIAHVLDVPPVDLFLRAGLVYAEDFGQRPVLPMYRDAIDLDRDLEYYASQRTAFAQTFADERDRFQDTVIALVAATRDRVQRLAESAGIAAATYRRRSSGQKNGE